MVPYIASEMIKLAMDVENEGCTLGFNAQVSRFEGRILGCGAQASGGGWTEAEAEAATIRCSSSIYICI